MDKHELLQVRFRPALGLQWDDLTAVLGRSRVIVSANVVAQAREALAARLMQHPGFRIDPVTYRFAPDSGWFASDDGPKRSYLELDAAFGRGLPFGLLGTKPGWRRRGPGTTQRFVTNVLGFQYEHLLHETREAIRLFTSEDLREIEQGLRPAGLLAPYDVVKNAEDLADQSAIWRVSPPRYEGVPVEAVLALHPQGLDDLESLRSVVNAMDSHVTTGSVWLWIPGFRPNPTRIGERRLRNLRALVQRLGDRRVLRILHGGFLEMLLSFDGAEEIASDAQIGVAGAHAKGGGYAVGQFYATSVHSLIHYSQARAVLKQCGSQTEFARELCPCALCEQTWERVGPKGFEAMFLTGMPVKAGYESPQPECAEANRMHALVARNAERQLIRTSTLRDLLMDASQPRLLNGLQARLDWAVRTVS